jgi:O-antigen/teichoic acid export membrane protein
MLAFELIEPDAQTVSLKSFFKVRYLVQQAWHSPTITTWGSFTTRSLSLALVLPLILSRFSTEEIVLWYLFNSIISLQLLADLGFTPTFSRVIAYAMAGASELEDYRDAGAGRNAGAPNWGLMDRIWSTSCGVYSRLVAVVILFLATLGTAALLRPIAVVSRPDLAWAAWGIILIASSITMWGNTYSAYLQGINQIALLRRWDIFTSLGSIFTSFGILMLGGHLFSLVLVMEIWLIINVLRNRWLCGVVENRRFRNFTAKGIDKQVISVVWPSAWRSGVGVMMSYGLTQLSGIIYAQFSSAPGVAAYLISLRVLEMISSFSQAPFYSKLPLLARLRSAGKLYDQVRLAKRGMNLAHWSYVLCFIALGVMAQPLLKLIGSHADFANPLLWILMGFGGFVERYGAMHLQLYSTTNHIVWHIANGITGAIYIAVSILLFGVIGVYAFPLALILGQLGFYSWYSAKHSYGAFDLRFWAFERLTMLAPLLTLCLYAVGSLACHG